MTRKFFLLVFTCKRFDCPEVKEGREGEREMNKEKKGNEIQSVEEICKSNR